ncbi:MAG TPA: 23S rRNA (guanosine(2251)-2'-O)-methyltransferase RlmB [Coriobacteriia bacterium]|jgi:23S rRNA (guanosine2251-2'-O)-methyltransferase
MPAEVIEGRNAVLEALRAGRRITRLLMAEGVKPNPALDEIRRLAGTAGVRVEQVQRRALDSLSARGAHQGVAAYAEPFAFTALGRVAAEHREDRRSLIVALDHVTDPGNLGAVARSCEAVGAHAVIVPKDRSAPVTAVTEKAAAGALSYLPLVQVTNLAQSLRTLKDAGYWVAGADEDAETDVWDADLDARLVVVAGAEGSGLSRLTRESCDFLVRLPVVGRVGSLNVAQAVSVLVYEWLRRGRHREA